MHAVCVAPMPQRELDHTDEGYMRPERASSCSGYRQLSVRRVKLTHLPTI